MPQGKLLEVSSHPVSSSIRSLYETYPYPSRIPGGTSDPYLELLWSFSNEPHARTRSFLDAGCGTGVNVLGGAILYPHFQVYGCDLNRVALEELNREKEALNLENLHLREMDLMRLDPEFGPPEGFDIIFSTGVIHHTPNPTGILQSLASRLAPQGVLRLMVYGESGRADLYRFARVARRLYNSLDWPEKVERARSLMTELEASGLYRAAYRPPVFRGPWEDAVRIDDTEFADRYLNPHDQPFSIPTLKRAIDDAGLRLLDWFEPRDWDLQRLLPKLVERGRVPEERWERYRLIERLFDRPKLDLYLVGPHFQPRRLKLVDNTYLGLNPQLFLHLLKSRGVSIHRAARLRLGPERPLSPDEGRILEAFGLRFIPFQTIVTELPNPTTAYWRPVVERLLEENFLFSPHPSPSVL